MAAISFQRQPHRQHLLLIAAPSASLHENAQSGTGEFGNQEVLISARLQLPARKLDKFLGGQIRGPPLELV